MSFSNSPHGNLSALYGHSGSFVPSKTDADADDSYTRFTPTARDEAVAHLARVRRERRATAPSERRARTKMEEAMERGADSNAKIQLSVSAIVAGEHVAPFTLQEHEIHALRHAESEPAVHARSRALSPQTPASSTPRTPTTPKAAGRADYLHDAPAGVSGASPHFTHAEDDTEHLPTWLQALPALGSAAKPDAAKGVRRRATWEGIAVAKSAEAEAVRAHLADLQLREACAAARKVAPKPKKPSVVAKFIKSVKSKLPSRSRAKRSLNAQSDFK